MSERRTLLYLARDFPIPVSSSTRLRTYNWILHLSKRFDITFVASVRRAPDLSHLEALRPYCKRLVVVPRIRRRGMGWLQRLHAELAYLWHGIPPEAWFLQRGPAGRVVESLRRETRFDAVFAERWTWGARALGLGRISILDAGAVEAGCRTEMARHDRHPLRRLLRGQLARALRRGEREVLRTANLVLTRNAAERRRVEEARGDGATVVLPPGLDTSYFKPRRRAIDPSNILFFGSLASPAQRDALLHLHYDLMPRVRLSMPRAHVTVLAPRLVPELESLLQTDPTISFTGPLDDARPEFWRAAVAAVPLRFGSGSPARIAQLLAMGIPVVASAAAARRLDLASGDGLIIVPEQDDFAQALVQVLLDTSLRDDLSRRGRQTAEARLSMASTYARLSDSLALHAPHS